MNPPFEHQLPTQVRTLRQQKLEFARSDRWQQLPVGAQQACREALSRLLCQVISATHDVPSQGNDDER